MFARAFCRRAALPTPARSLIRSSPRTLASDASSVPLKKTALYDLHAQHNAKMVPFAGYSMPITYPSHSILESHAQVRSGAGLFDVSHMVQHHLRGPGALEFLHLLTPTDITLMQPHTSALSVFLHPVTGGIVDDLMITMLGPQHFYVVTNAACKDKDLAYMKEHLETFSQRKEVEHEVLHYHGLVALQGPQSAAVLANALTRAMGPNAPELGGLFFGHTMELAQGPWGPMHIARGGYTGMDGFEISVAPEHATEFSKTLLEAGGGAAQLAGLGVRDTLRLEAGLCLYGHDLDDSTTPIEAGLKWVVGKKRVAQGGFLGHETVGRQFNDWKLVERRRIGLVVEGSPAREGAEIVAPDGQALGKATSGCPSPTTGKNIAMGYVKSGFHKTGTEMEVLVRGKKRKGVVTKMPFVQPSYYK